MGRPPLVSNNERLAVRYDMHVLKSNQFQRRLPACEFCYVLWALVYGKSYHGHSCHPSVVRGSTAKNSAESQSRRRLVR